jgi:hypothetical protein
MPADSNAHVAVLDHENLDGEVLIWWVPHLIRNVRGDHEYLAHGIVRGSGYTAVPLREMTDRGLYDDFPELRTYHMPSRFVRPCLTREHVL